MELIPYNGTMMIPGWPAKIRQAQRKRTYKIGGAVYQRIPYGSESEDCLADVQPCHDCGVLKGQLHVPVCDLEECPKCGGQWLTCQLGKCQKEK